MKIPGKWFPTEAKKQTNGLEYRHWVITIHPEYVCAHKPGPFQMLKAANMTELHQMIDQKEGK
jgi:hypothetical protein